MPNFSQTIIIGHLTRDPEVKFLASGTAVCEFGIAVNDEWFDKQTQEKKSEVCFIDCTLFGKRGEALAQHLHKGDALTVIGKLKMDQWDDKETGKKRIKHKIKVSDTVWLGSRDGGGGQQGSHQPPAEQPKSQEPASPADSYYDAPAANDDIPF